MLPRHVSFGPGKVMAEVIPLAVATNYPVAVVDEDGGLLSKIGNNTLLRNLVAKENLEAVNHD